MSKGWRYYIMITSGVIAELLTFMILWFGTNCQIFTVLFWMMVVAFTVAGGIWYMTDPKRKPWSPEQVPFVTLDRNVYRKGGKK